MITSDQDGSQAEPIGIRSTLGDESMSILRRDLNNESYWKFKLQNYFSREHANPIGN